MLQPWGKGLMGTTLRYAYEVRDATGYFDDLPDVTRAPGHAEAGRAHPRQQAGDFEPATFADRYEEAVVAMLRTKQSGRAVSTTEPRFRDKKVFDLMEALRRSITGTPKQAEAPIAKAKTKRPSKRIEGQREMLLPIAGKKTAEPKTRSSSDQGDIEAQGGMKQSASSRTS